MEGIRESEGPEEIVFRGDLLAKMTNYPFDTFSQPRYMKREKFFAR